MLRRSRQPDEGWAVRAEVCARRVTERTHGHNTTPLTCWLTCSAESAELGDDSRPRCHEVGVSACPSHFRVRLLSDISCGLRDANVFEIAIANYGDMGENKTC